MRSWSARFRRYLEEIAAVHPSCADIDLDDLSDTLACLVDGAIIMSKALNDPRRLERQVLLFRNLVKLVFSGAPASAPSRPAEAMANGRN